MSIAVDVDMIPADLQVCPRWVLWNEEPRNGRSTKVPYQAIAPTTPASSTDSSTWAPFELARDAYFEGKADGLGFVLGSGFCGLDIDKCIDPSTGEPDEAARTLIAEID